MQNSLRLKLILFTFGSILLTIIVAGTSIDFLLANLYGERAKHDFELAYELIYDDISSLENNISNQSLTISMEPTVISSVNLINRYQDKANYQPLIFDEEKKKIAFFLLKQINRLLEGSAAIYSKDGELIAYAGHKNNRKLIGITTYNNNKTVYLTNNTETDEWHSQTLPPSLESNLNVQAEWDSFTSRTGRIEYMSSNSFLSVAGLRTIQREYPDKRSELIGFVKIITEVNKHYIDELSARALTIVSLHLANNSTINKPSGIDSLRELDKFSNLFGSIGGTTNLWLPNDIYYIHSYVFPVINGKVFFLISQPKSDLNSALNRSRIILFAIFLFTALLVIPFAIYWLSTRVSGPLNALTQQLSKFENNEYPVFNTSDSKDEISLLGNGLNNMVAAIKSREEELKTSQINLNEAQHLAKIGSWKLDIINKKLECSDEMYNVFELVPGTSFSSYDALLEVVYPDDKEYVKTAYYNSLINGQSYDITHRLQMKSGSVKYIRQHCETTFDKSGKAIFSKGTVQDITEQKQKDEIVSRSHKMDALGKLTGGIAHDYNNMLGVVNGYAELLENMLGEQPKLARYAGEIRRAGERGTRLTKKLLSFSRKTESKAERVDLNVLLQEQQNMLEKTLTVRIKLVLELTENLWPVWLDARDMEDVILNLSINAMHAIDGNGQLTFQTTNESLSSFEAQLLNLTAGDYIKFSITDTGCGMDDATREKIFDPFFSTKGDKGTGLGLSQVYGFVERSNGVIKVYSELGHGTQFVLYFPRHTVTVTDDKTREHDESTDLSGKETILIVDDEIALLDLSRDILSQHGYQVYCASSGQDALDILENKTIALVVSDVIMPEMDGFELAEIIHNKYPDIIVQLASGFSGHRHLRKNEQNIKHDILHKPFSSRTLLKRVRSLLDKCDNKPNKLV